MAKAKITVIQKTVATAHAHFSFGRGDAGGDNWQWRQYPVASVSAASALRFERAMNEQTERVKKEWRFT